VPERKLNYRFMAAEAAWILSGSNRLSSLLPFCKAMATFSDDGTFMRGAYGPKVMDQLGYVVDCLIHDSHTRQAVLAIWRERPGASKDIPCTLTMQFLLRWNQLYHMPSLHTIVNMRSSDVWLGLPYDLFTFSMIAMAVIIELRRRAAMALHGIALESSTLTIFAGSQHLYATNFIAANEILRAHVPDEPEIGNPGHIRNDVLTATSIDQLIDTLSWMASVGDIHDPKSLLS